MDHLHDMSNPVFWGKNDTAPHPPPPPPQKKKKKKKKTNHLLSSTDLGYVIVN